MGEEEDENGESSPPLYPVIGSFVTEGSMGPEPPNSADGDLGPVAIGAATKHAVATAISRVSIVPKAGATSLSPPPTAGDTGVPLDLAVSVSAWTLCPDGAHSACGIAVSMRAHSDGQPNATTTFSPTGHGHDSPFGTGSDVTTENAASVVVAFPGGGYSYSNPRVAGQGMHAGPGCGRRRFMVVAERRPAQSGAQADGDVVAVFVDVPPVLQGVAPGAAGTGSLPVRGYAVSGVIVVGGLGLNLADGSQILLHERRPDVAHGAFGGSSEDEGAFIVVMEMDYPVSGSAPGHVTRTRSGFHREGNNDDNDDDGNDGNDDTGRGDAFGTRQSGSGPNFVIVSQRIDAVDGSYVGPVMPVGVLLRHEVRPRIAADPLGFLVTFEYDFFGDGTDWDLAAQLLDRNGDFHGVHDYPFYVAASLEHESSADIAYLPNHESFAITWITGDRAEGRLLNVPAAHLDDISWEISHPSGHGGDGSGNNDNGGDLVLAPGSVRSVSVAALPDGIVSLGNNGVGEQGGEAVAITWDAAVTEGGVTALAVRSRTAWIHPLVEGEDNARITEGTIGSLSEGNPALRRPVIAPCASSLVLWCELRNTTSSGDGTVERTIVSGSVSPVLPTPNSDGGNGNGNGNGTTGGNGTTPNGTSSSPTPTPTPTPIPSAAPTPTVEPTPVPTSTPLAHATVASFLSPQRPYVGQRTVLTIRLVNTGDVPIASAVVETGLSHTTLSFSYPTPPGVSRARVHQYGKYERNRGVGSLQVTTDARSLAECVVVELPPGSQWINGGGNAGLDRVVLDPAAPIQPLQVVTLRWECAPDSSGMRPGPAVPLSIATTLRSPTLEVPVSASILSIAPWPATVTLSAELVPAEVVEGGVQWISITVSNTGVVDTSDVVVDMGAVFGLASIAGLFANGSVSEAVSTGKVTVPIPCRSSDDGSHNNNTCRQFPMANTGAAVYLSPSASGVGVNYQRNALEIASLPIGGAVRAAFGFAVGSNASAVVGGTSGVAFGLWVGSSFPKCYPTPESGLVAIRPLLGVDLSVSVGLAAESQRRAGRHRRRAGHQPIANPISLFADNNNNDDDASDNVDDAEPTGPQSVKLEIRVVNNGPRSLSETSGVTVVTNLAALLESGVISNATGSIGGDVSKLPATFGPPPREPIWKTGPLDVGASWTLGVTIVAGNATLESFDWSLGVSLAELPPGMREPNVAGGDSAGRFPLGEFLRAAHGVPTTSPEPSVTPVVSPDPSTSPIAPQPSQSPAPSDPGDNSVIDNGGSSGKRGGAGGGMKRSTVLALGIAGALAVFLLLLAAVFAVVRKRVIRASSGRYESLSVSVEMGAVSPGDDGIVPVFAQPPGDVEELRVLGDGPVVVVAEVPVGGVMREGPMVPPREGDVDMGVSNLLQHDYDEPPRGGRDGGDDAVDDGDNGDENAIVV